MSRASATPSRFKKDQSLEGAQLMVDLAARHTSPTPTSPALTHTTTSASPPYSPITPDVPLFARPGELQGVGLPPGSYASSKGERGRKGRKRAAWAWALRIRRDSCPCPGSLCELPHLSSRFSDDEDSEEEEEEEGGEEEEEEEQAVTETQEEDQARGYDYLVTKSCSSDVSQDPLDLDFDLKPEDWTLALDLPKADVHDRHLRQHHGLCPTRPSHERQRQRRRISAAEWTLALDVPLPRSLLTSTHTTTALSTAVATAASPSSERRRRPSSPFPFKLDPGRKTGTDLLAHIRQFQ